MLWIHHGHFFFPGLLWFGLSNLLWLLLLGLLIFGLVRMLSHRSRPWGWFNPGAPFNQPQQTLQAQQGPQAPPMTQQQAPYQPFAAPSNLSAIEILRQRYARGEIDAATFDQMRERLEAPIQASQS